MRRLTGIIPLEAGRSEFPVARKYGTLLVKVRPRQCIRTNVSPEGDASYWHQNRLKLVNKN